MWSILSKESNHLTQASDGKIFYESKEEAEAYIAACGNPDGYVAHPTTKPKEKKQNDC